MKNHFVTIHSCNSEHLVKSLHKLPDDVFEHLHRLARDINPANAQEVMCTWDKVTCVRDMYDPSRGGGVILVDVIP